MIYSIVCPNCSEKSDPEERFCPHCGTEKQENVLKSKISDSIIEQIASKINFTDDPVFYLRILLNTIFVIAGILLIPKFIWESELVWLGFIIYAIFSIVKEIELRFIQAKGIYTLARILCAAYIGAGLGNFISYAGKNHNYQLGYYFNLHFLLDEISSKNTLIFIGAIGGISTAFFLIYFIRQFKRLN